MIAAMRTFITSRDIEDYVVAGRKEIRLDPEAVVTAEAEEKAGRMGVRLIRMAGGESQRPAGEPRKQVPPTWEPCEDQPTRGSTVSQVVNPGLEPAAAQVPISEARVTPRLDLLVRGGRVVLPGTGVYETDVWVKDGKVVGLGTGVPGDAATVISAEGSYVLPGVIDPHVHLGLFAPLAEELATEGRSALLGGVTTLGCFFGGELSHLQFLPQLERLVAANSGVDLFAHLVIGTRQQLEEIPAYVEWGVTSFKLYMCGIPGLIPDVDDGFILAVLRRCAELPRRCVVCVHAENSSLVNWATEEVRAHTADPNLWDWAQTHPDVAEAEAIRRVCFLAREAGSEIYVVHVTSEKGLEAIRQARSGGATVYAEVASPYLATTWESDRGTAAKMVPPFRGRQDQEALWRALEDGTVTALGTDNVTMTRTVKRLNDNMWDVMPGYPALGTHLGTVLSEGVSRRGISVERVAELMCRAPAQVFGLYPRKGTILPGSDADMVLVDPKRKRQVRVGELGSRADFSIFEGRELEGWPCTVVKEGEVVVHNGALTGSPAKGRFLKR